MVSAKPEKHPTNSSIKWQSLDAKALGLIHPDIYKSNMEAWKEQVDDYIQLVNAGMLDAFNGGGDETDTRTEQAAAQPVDKNAEIPF